LLLKLSEPPQRAITKRAVIAAILLLLGVATVGHDDRADDVAVGVPKCHGILNGGTPGSSALRDATQPHAGEAGARASLQRVRFG